MPETATVAGPQRRPARWWLIALGVIVLFIAMVNSTRPATDNSTAAACGRLTGLLILLAISVRLIAAGVPKTLGDAPFITLRRKAYYKLLGLGFLAMLGAFVALTFSSFIGAAVAVSWVYWFGWTWIAWLIADKKARKTAI